MITDWLIGLAETVLGFFLEAAPALENEADFVVAADDLITPFATGIYNLGAWLPWDTIVMLFHLVPGVYLVSLFARFLRAILGHIPQIGGNG